MIRTILRRRRDFEARLGKENFGDGARDMLMDLYASELEGRPIYVSSLSIASAVPATTALRQIALLVERGLLVRSDDPDDGRRAMLSLTQAASRQIEEWIDATVAAVRVAIS